MTDRHEKAKRVLDNSTKIVAIIGVLAVLFAVWFSIKFAKSKTKQEFDNRQTYFNDIYKNFDKEWANNAYWDSVGVEYAEYKSKNSSIRIDIRKETFNDQFNVKTSTTARPDLYKVLNASISLKNNTDTLYQAQLTTLCMNPLVLHKLTIAAQHTWGITHKSYFNNKSVITLKFDSYKDKEGISDKVFPKDVLFEDQLPIVLRTLKFSDSTKFNVDVLESQISDGVGACTVYKAAVSMKMEEGNVVNVEIKLNDKLVQHYYFETTYPNRLLKFEKNGILFERVQ